MKKKIFKILVIVLFLTLFLGTTEVNAARVTIVKDENPERVDVLSLSNDEFYVNIDDDTEIGYLIHCFRDVEELIGTCEIFVVDLNESTSYLLCAADENSLGTIVISIDDNEQIITSVNGELSNIFYIGTNVVIDK